MPITNLNSDVMDNNHLSPLFAQYTPAEQAYLQQAQHWFNHLQTDGVSQQTMRERLQLLDTLKVDAPTLATALLYPAWQQQQLAETQIKQICPDCLPLFQALKKLSLLHELELVPELEDEKQRLQQIENLRRLLLVLVEDVRVVLIQLAERLSLLRQARELPTEQQAYVAQETLNIYAPLANRLGIGRFKWELEDLSLRVLQPEAYQKIAKSLDSRRQDREAFLQDIMQKLREMSENLGIPADISGRPKHIYSIWKKMQRKHVDISEIFDALAVRLLVDDVAQCYTLLGLVHSQWQPIPGEFDDYIAAPKPNGYRSLHTALIGDDGKQFEVQIRTRDMHQLAELGVASHWRYKEGIKHDAAFEQKLEWLRQLLENQEQATPDEDDDDNSRRQRLYVLTPQGRVVDLPANATPLDFAYYIHTSLGHRCRGAKVNQRIVPLNHRLQNGDTVDILTAPQERPSRDWINPQLGYLHSSRARAKVRLWLNKQNAEQHLNTGREWLERGLHRLNINQEAALETLRERFHAPDTDIMQQRIGRGDISMEQIAAALKDLILPEATKKTLKLHESRNSEGKVAGISVAGVDGLLTHTAKCCHPLPGDAVVGFVTREQGISIHRRDCPNMQQWLENGNERLIEVTWQAASSLVYPVDVLVRAYDRSALLRDVIAVFTSEKVNITASRTGTDKRDNIATLNLSIEVTSAEQLSGVLHRIESLPNVMDVRRLRQ